MLTGFALIAVLLWVIPAWRLGASAALRWSGTGTQLVAGLLLLVGLALFGVTRISLAAARPVYVIWMTVALRIGMVMTTVLLTLLFVVLLPVFSVVVRLGDPLRKRLHSGKTYWEDYKPYNPSLERMKRPF